MPEEREGRSLIMATRCGFIKKTKLSEFENIRANGLIAVILREGDELVQVALTSGSDDIILGTRLAKAIRFNEKNVRNMGRATQGVTAIDLAEEDYVINMAVVKPGASVLTITENGYGKRSDPDEYRVINRGGKGIITHELTDKTGALVELRMVEPDEDIMLITSDGVIIRTPVEDIRLAGRATQGVIIMRVAEDVKVVCAAPVPAESDEDANETDNAQTDSPEAPEEI